MLQVASSFGAEPSMDTVIYSIPVRISEAVVVMQENMEIYTSKVRIMKISIFSYLYVGRFDCTERRILLTAMFVDFLHFRYSSSAGTAVKTAHQARYQKSRKRKQVQ